jgi:hypothetical protein
MEPSPDRGAFKADASRDRLTAATPPPKLDDGELKRLVDEVVRDEMAESRDPPQPDSFAVVFCTMLVGAAMAMCTYLVIMAVLFRSEYWYYYSNPAITLLCMAAGIVVGGSYVVIARSFHSRYR